MQPTKSLKAAVCARPWRAVAVAALISTSLIPQSAGAFFQSTSVEGVISQDIGGVWLAVHHVLPEFRIRFEKPQGVEKPEEFVPFKVGPVPSELALAFGREGAGVAITEIVDQRLAARYGINEGDVIRKVNTYRVTDLDSWKEGLENAPKIIILTIRRPYLKHSRVRLVKISYEATSAREEAGDGTETVLAEENVDLEVLDVALPVESEVESRREKSQFWTPTQADLETLRGGWFELPLSSPLKFLRGEHRIVALARYTADLLSDENLSDTLFGMILKMDANPIGAGGGQVIDIYGVQNVTEGRIDGTYVSAVIAQAPFPISVEFKGAFTMTRLGEYSDKDVEWRAAQAKEQGEAQMEDLQKVELAPDIPAEVD